MTRSRTLSSRSDLFRKALSERVLVADGAMGTMLQAANPTMDDFQGHEGCNEILNITRPDIVRSVHDAYFAVGVDAVETNTFGANLANLGEYGISDRIYELAESARSAFSSRNFNHPFCATPNAFGVCATINSMASGKPCDDKFSGSKLSWR